MNSKTKTIISILLPVVILGIMVAIYYLRQPGSVKSQKSVYQVSSMALNKEFLMNDSIAGDKYNNKVIEVTGPVANIRKSEVHGIILTMDDAMMGMRCVMDSTVKAIPDDVAIGSLVKIKGILIGFDPMIGLMMNKCVVTESKPATPTP